LIQQNKHLHCVSLTDSEGEAITEVFKTNDLEYAAGDKQIKKQDKMNDKGRYI